MNPYRNNKQRREEDWKFSSGEKRQRRKQKRRKRRRRQQQVLIIRGPRGTNRGRVRAGRSRSSSTSFFGRGQALGRGTIAPRNVSSGITTRYPRIASVTT